MSRIAGVRVKIGEVSDQPRAEVWLVKASISELKFSIARIRKEEKG